MVMDVNGMNSMTMRDVQTMEGLSMVEWVQQEKHAVGVVEEISTLQLQ